MFFFSSTALEKLLKGTAGNYATGDEVFMVSFSMDLFSMEDIVFMIIN